MQQHLPQLDPILSPHDALRQEAIAVHARLQAVQAFMARQRARTVVCQRESSAVGDGGGAQADVDAHSNP